MQRTGEERFDLSAAKATALGAAREWGLALEQPFAFSCVSYVAPSGEAVVKVAWEGDDESLHEGDADEFRVRAWTVIRGAYLRPAYADPIRALL